VVPLIQGVPPGPDLNPGNIGVFTNGVIPGVFDQQWFFQLALPSNLMGAVHSIQVSGLTARLIYAAGTKSQKGYKLANPFSLVSLPAGLYDLFIAGEALGPVGGYYGGAFLVTPAPLPVPPPPPLL
jgi:hypothetical protein